MERHKIPMQKGRSVRESLGFTAIEEIGRYQLDEDKKYVHKSWTNDSKRLKKIPTAEDLDIEPIDLNAGFDKDKIDVSFGDKDIKMFHALLEWIYIKAFDLKANNVRIVTNAAAIYELMQSPYGRHPHTHDFKILATKHNGILYMMRYYEDDPDKSANFHLVKYRGKRFRDCLVVNREDGDSKSGDTNGDTNNNESGRYKKWIVNKTTFGGLNMLYTTEIAAVNSKDRYMSLHCMPEDIFGTFSYWRRLVRHWSIAMTTGAPMMLIGLRERLENDDPASKCLLKRIEKVVVNEIPEKVKNSTEEGKRIPWEPRICYRTLEAVIDTLLGLMVDDPKVLYQVQFGEPNESGYYNHLMVSQVSRPKSFDIDFIPDWYL